MRLHSFDSAGDMFDFLDDSVKHGIEAAKTHPIKVGDLKHGDYAVSVSSIALIFIEVIEHTTYPEDDESIVEGRAQGMVYGKCFSEVCPKGELGDTHITNITTKITAEDFQQAKSNGFTDWI